MSTKNSDLAAAASARCAGPFNNSHVTTCERTLRIGFFFDGFGRHLFKDLQSGRVSNVGKMFLAHPIDMPNKEPDPAFAYRKAYISGMGEEYIADLTTTANAGMDIIGKKAADIPKDVAQDRAKEVFKDVLDGRNWWERLKRDVKSVVNAPIKIFKVVKSALVDAVAEAIPPLRDNPGMAQVAKTGANVRIDGAIDYLNVEIGKVKALSGPPLKRIELSVYGFDYGATLARGFLYRLRDRSLINGEEVEYQGARLVVLFAGLFDAVDRSHTKIPLVDDYIPVPTSTVLGDSNGLPKQVRQALHLVAAHERRFYRRASLLGKGNAKWREELMPGVSEDVGGSLLPGEQKPSAELALVSLHRMYRAAFQAGAPFPHIEDLHLQGRKLSSLFTFNDHVNGKGAFALVKHYQQAAKASIAQLKNLNLGNKAPFLGHMRLYIRWLASISRPYVQRLREIGEEEDRLNASQYAAGNSAGMFSRPMETQEKRQTRLKRTQELQTERETLRAQLGWLEDVDSEARSMRSGRARDGYRAAGTPQQMLVWQVLLEEEWFKEQLSPLPEEVSLLFGHFIHDQLVQSLAQQSAKSMSGQCYFDIRGIDLPEEEEKEKEKDKK
ncbi:hypothetical protein C4K10_3007 [Pseudomonas chlororaphis subsp. aureofaciens]|uniref:phospholipase effector Tle1 domain-containing protein n=1 Tax=Pseudomonas chlororaphis TaxID=587753 RepID=UPI000F6DF6AA|nr:DUF2235 domain-containing protein [Pseudomonas chlororaphis]AZE11287.1 hypothetical protein C4K10_3007 [Pseudomonas chlororaphis subsp. aureofaciens]AZE17293.1 hypothetical protein C4K09_2832 [Pseudomonas chlororaphis subsp. aureofaciens]